MNPKIVEKAWISYRDAVCVPSLIARESLEFIRMAFFAGVSATLSELVVQEADLNALLEELEGFRKELAASIEREHLRNLTRY